MRFIYIKPAFTDNITKGNYKYIRVYYDFTTTKHFYIFLGEILKLSYDPEYSISNVITKSHISNLENESYKFFYNDIKNNKDYIIKTALNAYMNFKE